MLDMPQEELIEFLGKGFCESVGEDFDSFDFKDPANDMAFASFSVGAAMAKECPREQFYIMGLRDQLIAFTTMFVKVLGEFPKVLPEFIVNNLELDETTFTFKNEMAQISANFAMTGFDWYLKTVPNERAN